MSTDITEQHWYTTGQLAELLHVDASTLRRWRTANPPEGPAFVRVSARNVIYSRADVRSWLEARRVEPGPAA
jgi:DNA-binding transcriptional MerR regulator